MGNPELPYDNKTPNHIDKGFWNDPIWQGFIKSLSRAASRGYTIL